MKREEIERYAQEQNISEVEAIARLELLHVNNEFRKTILFLIKNDPEIREELKKIR